MAVVWKFGSMFKGDAEKIYSEIQSIGEEATAKQILDYARDESTELHKCFEWDNSIAAERWRLQQARLIVCNLVYQEPEKQEPTKIRVLQSTECNTYKPVRLILQNKSEYEQLLERALAELHAFKERYKNLSELEEILALIE